MRKEEIKKWEDNAESMGLTRENGYCAFTIEEATGQGQDYLEEVRNVK